jgi:hypothetical protein
MGFFGNSWDYVVAAALIVVAIGVVVFMQQ